jgi:hypothetical protein
MVTACVRLLAPRRAPEWERNLEAGRLAGSEIGRAVSKLEKEANAEVVGSSLAIEEKARELQSPKPLDISRFFDVA